MVPPALCDLRCHYSIRVYSSYSIWVSSGRRSVSDSFVARRFGMGRLGQNTFGTSVWPSHDSQVGFLADCSQSGRVANSCKCRATRSDGLVVPLRIITPRGANGFVYALSVKLFTLYMYPRFFIWNGSFCIFDFLNGTSAQLLFRPTVLWKYESYQCKTI